MFSMGTEGSGSISPVDRDPANRTKLRPTGLGEYARGSSSCALAPTAHSRQPSSARLHFAVLIRNLENRLTPYQSRYYCFGNIAFQSSFMLTTVHFFATARSSALSKPPMREP